MAGAGDIQGRSSGRWSRLRIIDLDRLYERLGSAYVVLIVACAGAIAVVNVAINILVASLYEHPIASVIPRVLAVAEALNVLGLLAGLLLTGRPIWRMMAWIRAGEPPSGARQAWEDANSLPRSAVPGTAAVIMVAEIPAIVYAHSLVPELSIPVTFIGVLETVAAAALLIFLVVEAMTRPIARRALAADPQLGVPPPAAATLRRKLIVGLPIVNMMTAYVAAGGASAGSGASERLAAGVLAAFVVSLTVSLVLTMTLSRSLSAPVDELVEATERVEHGDLEARLTPLAADELGTLAGRFNQMLIGLRERESLRADVRRQADELRESRTRIVAAADAERRRVERDLHDGAQQQLVLAQLKLGVAESAIGTDPDAAKAMVVELRGDLRRALAELRDLAHGIYPAVLENEGLPAALREAAARAGIPATFESVGTGRYSPGLEAALYFCCLEALQNIAKHAGEDPRVAIVLAERDHHLLLEVADTGRGFDSSKITASSGLTNMTDRVGALGGALEITSNEGQGTTVAAIIPLDGFIPPGGER